MPEFILPTDELFSQQWYLKTMKVHQAWRLLHNSNPAFTFGHPDIVTAICDHGILSEERNGVVTSVHPELNGQVSNGRNKIHSFYDFTTSRPNNNTVTEDHGMNCAGLVAASAGTIKISSGMMGVAPNTRLMAVKRWNEDTGVTEKQFARQLLRMAGFYPPSNPLAEDALFKDYIYHPDKAADIINMSFSWRQRVIEDLDPDVMQAFNMLAAKGRNGKGTIIINASGNNNNEVKAAGNYIPLYYRNCIVVGASSLNENGEEKFASYSNYGNENIQVTVCAPGSNVVNSEANPNAIVHNPPQSYGVLTATLPGQGNVTGYPNLKDNYGGTSASAPMVAGVVALMLTANPNLTAEQVKRILISSADKIDGTNTDPIAQWTTAIPFPNFRPIAYSRKYGYGRVNAESAVAKALEM